MLTEYYKAWHWQRERPAGRSVHESRARQFQGTTISEYDNFFEYDNEVERYMSKAKTAPGTVAVNKKARHLYELSEFLEAGISLTGPELKSIRLGRVNFQDSYVEFRKGEAWLVSMHIAPYDNAGYVEQNPDRDRRLLMHAREINKYAAAVAQKGLTVVPVKMYFHHGKVKVEIALGRGKKLFDKRESLKQRALQRDAERGE